MELLREKGGEGTFGSVLWLWTGASLLIWFISKNRLRHETSGNLAINFPVHVKIRTIYGLYGLSLSPANGRASL